MTREEIDAVYAQCLAMAESVYDKFFMANLAHLVCQRHAYGHIITVAKTPSGTVCVSTPAVRAIKDDLDRLVERFHKRLVQVAPFSPDMVGYLITEQD